MRYILDDTGYIDSVSCTPFNCKDKSCQEYIGTIPSGYNSLEEWALNANIRAYKIVDNNLVYDSAKDAEIEAELALSLNVDAPLCLYNNTSGSTGTITLKEDASNFSAIEIMYGADSVYFSTGKIYSPNGKTIATAMQKIRSANNIIDLYTSNWTISTNKITFVKASNKYLNDSSAVATAGTNAYVRIYKVVGYR